MRIDTSGTTQFHPKEPEKPIIITLVDCKLLPDYSFEYEHQRKGFFDNLSEMDGWDKYKMELLKAIKQYKYKNLITS